MKKKTHWSVIVAYVYLVFFLVVQISAFIHTSYQAKQIEKAYNRYKAQETSQLEEENSNGEWQVFDTVEYFKENIKSIIDAGEIAKTATPILVLNIWVSMFTTLFLILPHFVMDKIEDYVYKYSGNIDIDVFNKFCWIMFVVNTLIIFFDFYATKSYWDFANAFIK